MGPIVHRVRNLARAAGDDPTHPLHIFLRTYAVALALSLGPALLPVISAPLVAKPIDTGALLRVLRRELAHDGFASSFTICVGGGAAIRAIWYSYDSSQSTPCKDASVSPRPQARFLVLKTFASYLISSSVGIIFLQLGRKRAFRKSRAEQVSCAVSPTLDLTLLLLVRALDVALQKFLLSFSSDAKNTSRKTQSCTLNAGWPLGEDKLCRANPSSSLHCRRSRNLQLQLDAFAFWACSARIMWCFFYKPQRLPRSYLKWISNLANVDPRLLEALRELRTGTWSYRNPDPSSRNLLVPFAQGLGHPGAWGDPTVLPAFGGAEADAVWREMGVHGRTGVGGLPCEIVHGGVGASRGLGGSCAVNGGIRGAIAFAKSMAIYIPVHFLPIILSRPRTFLHPAPFLAAVAAAFRSAIFLSSFVTLYWYAVCLTRTRGLARLFPRISHDFWDGPYGCTLAGSLACGGSIWLERGTRRGEMVLYVAPKAIRTALPVRWLRGGRIMERVVFVVSLATLLTATIHRPDVLRGLSRWILPFVINGPRAGLWKRKRSEPLALTSEAALR